MAEIQLWGALFVLSIMAALAFGMIEAVWFAVGSAAALIAHFAGAVLWQQVLLFIAVSVVLLIVSRPLTKKWVNKRAIKTGAQALIGKEVRVIKTIDNKTEQGRAMVGGMEWTARSADPNVIIPKDAAARVVGIEGVKLIVEIIDASESEEKD